jgi:hypothetical protein
VEADLHPSERSPAQLAIQDLPAPSVTILVIEDARFVREVTCEILREAGYQVLQADSA